MFRSLDALFQEFGLDPSQGTDALATELERRRALTHADKTGGEFASEEAKRNFHRLSEAISYLRASANSALVPVDASEIRALRVSVASIQVALSDLNGIKTAQVKTAPNIKDDLSRPYTRIQIGSASFGAICAATLTFSGKLATNPVLSPFTSSWEARLSAFILLVASGIAFVVAWVNEQRLKSLADFLLSDGGLSDVIYWCVSNGHEEEPKVAFTKRMIVENILDIGKPYDKSPLFRTLKEFCKIRVTLTFAQQTADAQLMELTARGVIRKEGMKGIEPLYVIEHERAEEIVKDRHTHYSPRNW